MDWTKIPTSLITRRYSDHELLSIIKYQLIWSLNEESPDQETCLRYMTEKQFKTALEYCDSIAARVSSDVSLVIRKRNANKIRYSKNKEINKIQQAESLHTDDTQLEQIREDIDIDLNKTINIQDSLSASAENPLLFKDEGSEPTDFQLYSEKKPIQEGFVEFWKLYPRKINKPLAEKKYIQALKKTTADNILKGLKHYIADIEKFNTEEKYIKHPATWLNQECWVFEEEPKYQPKLDDEIRAKL